MKNVNKLIESLEQLSGKKVKLKESAPKIKKLSAYYRQIKDAFEIEFIDSGYMDEGDDYEPFIDSAIEYVKEKNNLKTGVNVIDDSDVVEKKLIKEYGLDGSGANGFSYERDDD